jgi:hypothetical protein
VDVFQLGNNLCFGLKAADEIRLVGELGQDDLDRYIPVDEMLKGTIDSTISAFTDGFEQIVTLDGAGWGIVDPVLLREIGLMLSSLICQIRSIPSYYYYNTD